MKYYYHFILELMNNVTEARIIELEKSRDLKFDLKHADKIFQPNLLPEVNKFVLI